jgi:hypothetical protein
VAMVDPKVAATARGASATSAGTGSGGITINLTITVSGGGDPEATGKAVQEGALAAFYQALEEAGIEVGVVGSAA